MSEKNEDMKQTIFDKIPFLKKLKTIKHIEIIIFAIFIILALLIAFSGSNAFSFLSSSSSKSSEASESTYSYFSTLDYVKSQEDNLTNLLTGIDGVKNVKVMLSVKSSGEMIYAKNLEEKTDKLGTTKTESIVFVTTNGVSKPLSLMEKLPEFNGAVIVTESAKDVKIKLSIISAVETLLGLSSENINVLV